MAHPSHFASNDSPPPNPGLDYEDDEEEDLDEMDSTPSTTAVHNAEDTSTHNNFDDLGDHNSLFPEQNTTLLQSNGNDSHEFPRAQTPQNDHLNAALPGELSPPRSQPQSIPQLDGSLPNLPPLRRPQQSSSNTGVSVTASGGMPWNQLNNGTVTETGAGNNVKKPGDGWKNKRAQEEMSRAWENVVDKEFSLKEFGDVILIGQEQLKNKGTSNLQGERTRFG